MSKAAILQEITKATQQLSKVNDKIEKLKTAKARVQMTETEIQWTPKSHSTIKSTNHLAGTPYKEMSEAEQKIPKKTSTKLDTAKEEMMELVDQVIKREEAKSLSIESHISRLRIQLEHEKD